MNLPRHHNNKAIVVALALALTACGKSPEQHFIQAQERVQKADYKAAVIELKTVLQEQPDNREARLMLGEVSLKNGAFSDAEKELSRARSLGIPDDRVLPSLAKAYVKTGDPQKALDLGIPTTGLTPQSLAALHTMRAEAQLSLGKRAEAELSVGVATQVDPKQPELLLTRAKLALLDKHEDQAGQLLDEALLQDPKFVEAFFLKAALLESDNKPDDAAKVYQQILANDPSQFRAHLAIANLQMKKGDTKAADKSILAAEKVAGKAPMVKYARGTLELQRGKLDKASDSFLEVLRVAPNHQPSMLAYAMSSYGLGNYEQSINHAGKVLGAAPNNLIAAKILAGSLLKTGDVSGALKTLAPHLANFPNDAGLLALAGEAHLRAKNYNVAMAYLERAAKLEPQNAAVRTRLAAGHLAGGNTDKALADLEAAASLNAKPSQTDMTLVLLHLKGKEYDKALQAISNLEKKLPNNPITHNLRAAALLGKQDRAGARKQFEQALAIEPTFLPAALNLARLDIADNKPEAARKRFEAILEKDKNNVQVMLALADLASTIKNEKGYISWLEKASKAQPASLQAQDRLIRFYLAKKDDKKALVIAKQAFSTNPHKPEALSMLGSTQVATGDLKGAIDSFTRLTEKAKDSPDAYLQLGMTQIINKQLVDARASLKRALQIKPGHIQSLDALLRLELIENKPDAALRIARHIQTETPTSPMGFDREADIHLSQKRAPEAIKAYEQALNKGGRHTVLVKLYRAHILAGDAKGADQRLKSWIKAHPDDQNMRLFAASQYLLANRDSEAIALYEDVLRKSPKHVVALNNLATLYQKQNDKRALPTAEQALKLAPQQPGIQDTVGWILVEQGQLPRALELLRAAASKLPQSGSVRYHYAVALAKSGNKAQAKQELQQALTSSQAFPEQEAAKALLKSL